jgi:hypothetical protein
MNEAAAFLGDSVDVGGLIAHQAIAVAAQVALADVVAPENEDVGMTIWHDGGKGMRFRPVSLAAKRESEFQIHPSLSNSMGRICCVEQLSQLASLGDSGGRLLAPPLTPPQVPSPDGGAAPPSSRCSGE